MSITIVKKCTAVFAAVSILLAYSVSSFAAVTAASNVISQSKTGPGAGNLPVQTETAIGAAPAAAVQSPASPSAIPAAGTSGTGRFTPVATAKTDASTWFGPGRLTMFANHDSNAQNLSVIIETGSGGMIVVDGGWAENSDFLLKEILNRGGHVEAWLITHPHRDHAMALAGILADHASEITIDGIYYSFLEDNWYAENDQESVMVIDALRAGFANIPADRLHGDIRAGQVIPAGQALIQVLNEPYRHSTNCGNNSSVVYMVSLNGTNVVFLGDLGLAGGVSLMNDIDLSSLKCDMVQLAHHGQSAVSFTFYRRLGARVFLWPTPQWLWDNDNGGGPGSGRWTTGETRKWQTGLLVKEYYVTKDGDITIE